MTYKQIDVRNIQNRSFQGMSFLDKSGQYRFSSFKNWNSKPLYFCVCVCVLPLTKSFYTHHLKLYSEKWGYINDLEAIWMPFELLREDGILFCVI